MTQRDWSNFLYDCADFFFGKQMDKAYNQGIRAGAEYASFKLSFAVRTLDTESMTKTQKIGHEAALAAMIPAKKDIMRKTGSVL